jgi:SAM-dependent methyltransferase
VSAVVRRYRGQPWLTRAYLVLRRIVLPVDEIERHVPPAGRVLDACCGYGLVALVIAMRGPDRQVVGVDLDADRIRVAREAAAGIANVAFEAADLRDVGARAADVIVLLDSLHYFSPGAQRQVLRDCRSALGDGGLLICRDALRERGPRYWWNWLHERVMVGFSITETRDRSLHFVTRNEMIEQLNGAGFCMQSEHRTRPWLPYSDRLFVARATGARDSAGSHPDRTVA